MKTLNLHCDYIKWKGLKKALKTIDEIAPNQELENSSEECLAVLISIEKDDNSKTSKETVKSIVDIAKQVKTKNIVLYPYAHLSSNLGNPKLAIKLMSEIENSLKSYSVKKAPFGYYKSFELKVKGHPLSELSREFHIEGSEQEAEDSEEIKRLVKKLSKVKMQAKAAENGLKSNVELGRDLDLYTISDVVGGGLPLLTPKGTTIKREIERFIVDEELKRGYLHTSTPIMAKSDLFKISGHWQHYKEDMFTLNVKGDDYALRPMTCPFHFVLYKRKPRTYKELPIKYAEIASLFRNEQSGELRGLTRMRQFTLADAHIICTEEEREEEFQKVLELVKFVMDKLGIEITYRFSKGDLKNKTDKYVDNPKEWKKSEAFLKKTLDNMKIKYVEAKDEAAFYGPKLDLQYKDVYGKEDTLITIQIDFALPSRFNLTYTDSKGKEKLATVIHRSSTGATERVISYLLEKNQGKLPTWLSPTQTKILTMSEDNDKYAKEINESLIQNKIRTELDLTNESIGKKAKKAYLEKVPFTITVGEEERKSKTLSIRKRGEKDIKKMSLEDFQKLILEEIKEKK